MKLFRYYRVILAFIGVCLVACGDGGSSSSSSSNSSKLSTTNDQLRNAIESQCGVNCSGAISSNPTSAKLGVSVRSLPKSYESSSPVVASQLRAAVRALPNTAP